MEHVNKIAALASFLFGASFLWMTPSLAGHAVEGTAWSVTQTLAVLTIAGFTATACGMLSAGRWWRGAAAGSAVLGIMTTVMYIVAVLTGPEVPIGTLAINASLHLIGLDAILLALIVQSSDRSAGHDSSSIGADRAPVVFRQPQ